VSNVHGERIERVRRALAEQKADFLLAPASADFRWITGARVRSTERLLCLVVPRTGPLFCIVPRLESDALAEECPWIERVDWDDDQDAFSLLAGRLALERRPVLLLSEGFRTAPLLALADRTPCLPAAAALEPLRAVKDDEELRLLAEAAGHADRLVMETAGFMRAGMTEREVQRFVFDHFEALGDTDAWAIVASGPNGALPHHMTSDRRLEEGDVVVLDLGAFTGGYASDITRTFWLGSPPAEAERIYAVVDEARRAGIAAVRVGAPAGAVDAAARAVIEREGYGACFTHRTGHGVGLEIHEPPYLVKGNDRPLVAGMAHSVEPGIYLPGRFGVRLEDIVVVEAGGARRLNQAPFAPAPQRVRG
jgi:Xaa-Pro aminopeptidase